MNLVTGLTINSSREEQSSRIKHNADRHAIIALERHVGDDADRKERIHSAKSK